MKVFYLTVLAVLLAFSSCGIESIEVTPKLSPPLGVTLSNVGGGDYGIIVKFYALNDETYLEGYNIYMATSAAELLANTGFLAPRSGGNTNIPTIPNVAAMSSPTLFTFNVTRFTNNVSFTHTITYFFCVRAYSSVYNIESASSEITNIQYLTN